MLNGHCISELSSCLDDAGPREIATTETFFQKLTSQLSSEERIMAYPNRNKNRLVKKFKSPKAERATLHRLDQFSNSKQLITLSKLFVPRPAMDAIEVGTFSSLAELREVTTLFLKLDSYSSIRHEDPVSLQSFFLIIQEKLQAQGGFMRQFLIDDKGCVFIGMWGVPSLAYTNNCSRALLCAVGIEMSVKCIGHSVSIGITTGSVFCGNIGSELRKDFVGIGATVNLAARFMSKAEGCILVDELTYSRLPSDMKPALSRSYGMNLKGVTEKVYPYFYVGGDSILELNTNITDVKSASLVMRKPVVDAFQDILETVLHYDSILTGKHVSLSTKRQEARDKRFSMLSNSGSKKKTKESLHQGSKEAKVEDGDITSSISFTSSFHRKVSREAPSQTSSSSLLPIVINQSGAFLKHMRRMSDHRIDISGVSDVVPALANCVVIEGLPGMGRATTVKHFLELTSKHKIRSINVIAIMGDEAILFSVFRKIFIALVGIDNFSTEDRQKSLLHDLMGQVSLVPDVEMEYMRIILGLEWSNNSSCLVESEDDFLQRTVLNNLKTFVKVLLSVITHLLSFQNTAIIIENAHHADYLSWHCLRLLLCNNIRLAVVLTIKNLAESDSNRSPLPNTSLSEDVLEKPSEDSSSSTSIVDYMKILQDPRCQRIVLSALNEDEVGDILIARIKNKQTITKKLVELVLEASSGNPYWCEAIAQYIDEGLFLFYLSNLTSKLVISYLNSHSIIYK